ncbi:MAG TPA: DUF1801 domain-containing protein [Thermoanaerobaculia bacterium]|nr:DUF1801 domain-containing protein [Thermoanaerobaculia bacterium]
MVRSSAQSVDEYMDALPEDRRTVIAELRELIRKHIPKGYDEAVSWGALYWQIPLKRYPDTYNGQPLGYVALASQKNYFSLYLFAPYMDPRWAAELKEGFRKAGKKLNMGKSCVRFKKPDDLALDVIAKAIAAIPPDEYIAMYERAWPGRKK